MSEKKWVRIEEYFEERILPLKSIYEIIPNH